MIETDEERKQRIESEGQTAKTVIEEKVKTKLTPEDYDNCRAIRKARIKI